MKKLIPIYSTAGEVPAYLGYPYIYDQNGEWIGFVTQGRDVYSVEGEYVGWVNDDPRIVRKISSDELKENIDPPPPTDRIRIQLNSALAPMLPELPSSQIDVLMEEPHKLFGS